MARRGRRTGIRYPSRSHRCGTQWFSPELGDPASSTAVPNALRGRRARPDSSFCLNTDCMSAASAAACRVAAALLWVRRRVEGKGVYFCCLGGAHGAKIRAADQHLYLVAGTVPTRPSTRNRRPCAWPARPIHGCLMRTRMQRYGACPRHGDPRRWWSKSRAGFAFGAGGRCEERAKVTASRCGRQPAAAKRAKTGGRFQIKRPALIRRGRD
jgi:hypothetical protein